MRVLCTAVLAVLLFLPATAAAATIPLDICTSLPSSPCVGSVAITIRAFEATRQTTVSVSAPGPVQIIGFAFTPLDPSPQFDLELSSSSGLVFTDNALNHPHLGRFTTTIDFPSDMPLSGFSFTATNPSGNLVLQPFELGRYLAVAHVVNIETGATAYRTAFWTTQQAEVIPMSPVPEPGSMLLLGSGLVAAWRARRRALPTA